ncbi:MAG: signal peptidase II [Thermomicrobiales bacterium]|nr:signal peptidase II [Thermomicrobiales bacterium]
MAMSTNHRSKNRHRLLAGHAGRWIWLAAIVGFMVVVLDALSKWGIAQEIGPGAARSHFVLAGDFIELRYAVNSGVAFGLLRGNSTLAGVLVGLVIVPLVIVLAVMATRGPLWAVASGLVVGGAAGNLLDRAGDGAVTDFIAVGRWPSFNFADASITVGALILLGLSLIEQRAHADTDRQVSQ